MRPVSQLGDKRIAPTSKPSNTIRARKHNTTQLPTTRVTTRRCLHNPVIMGLEPHRTTINYANLRPVYRPFWERMLEFFEAKFTWVRRMAHIGFWIRMALAFDFLFMKPHFAW